MLLVIVTVQVTKLPPPFSEPLHWSTVTGNARLVVPEALHVILPPPPLPDPLHWVTVGDPWELGIQAVISVPPPPPDPMHWLTVIAVGAMDALTTMLLVMLTLQIVVLPPTLLEPLHWWTAFTTSDEFTVSPVHGFRVQFLVKVTVELLPFAVILLTMLTLQVTVRGAPPGPALRLLHWLNETVVADTDSGFEMSSIKANTLVTRRSVIPSLTLLRPRPL